MVLGLPVGEQRLDLELERFDVWTEDGVFVINDNVSQRPDIVLLRGRVAGDADSAVVLGLGRYSTNGYIRTGGKVFSVSTGARQGQTAEARDICIADLGEFRFEQGIPFCGVSPDNLAELDPHGSPPPQAHDERGERPCRVARIAIDSDWEWTSQTFGGNAEAAGSYAIFLVAAVSEIYRRDVNVRLAVPYLRVFSENSDPYPGMLAPDPLYQLQSHWNSEMRHVKREAVHLFTGLNTSYGGIAFLNTLCRNESGYGVSSYLNGSFPYPLQMNSWNNWDLVVFAHELGHNFGTGHTHDSYDPPIDNCGINCSGNRNSTIMSYCHICSGGLMNIDLRFHPLVQERILHYLSFAPCDLRVESVARDDSATTVVDTPINIYVLANDAGPGCDAVGLLSVESPTPAGATVTVTHSPNPTGNPSGSSLRYVPAPGFIGTDTFAYTNSAGQGAQVEVEVLGYRQAEAITNERDGLLVSYHQIPPSESIPYMGNHSFLSDDIADQVNYPAATGPALGGPLATHMGAVFEGYLRAPADGLYTLELESDDGSRLRVGDRVVVNNNGVHGMVRASGTIALEQGDHPIRIDYFQATGAAGLIFRWTGPGVSGVVPASALRHPAQHCGPADLGAPYGVLDLYDIWLFLFAFVRDMPEADVAEPFGVLDLNDLTTFIQLFSEGCQ